MHHRTPVSSWKVGALCALALAAPSVVFAATAAATTEPAPQRAGDRAPQAKPRAATPTPDSNAEAPKGSVGTMTTGPGGSPTSAMPTPSPSPSPSPDDRGALPRKAPPAR